MFLGSLARDSALPLEAELASSKGRSISLAFSDVLR